MSFPHQLSRFPPSEDLEEPSAQWAAEQPMDAASQHMIINQEHHLSVQTRNSDAESTMGRICKIMCVTTNGAFMVLAWTIAAITFSGLSAYWILTTTSLFHTNSYLEIVAYPMSASLVLVLLLSPFLALAGDVRCGNFRLLLSCVIALNVAGLVSYAAMFGIAAATAQVTILYFFSIPYLLMFFAGGIFLTNSIQLGRDLLRDVNSPERSAFVHWYYWATYVPPTAAFIAVVTGVAAYAGFIVVVIALAVALVALLVFLLVTCIVHLQRHGWSTNTIPRVQENPIKQIFRVTRYAMQAPASPGPQSFWARLNKIRRSNGGQADDEEVDNVAKFWLLLLLMVSLFGFFFYDDVWAVPFTNAFTAEEDVISYFTSSHVTTALIVFISIPIYQLVVRPLLCRDPPPLLGRIAVGLIMQLVSLGLVTWTVSETSQSARSNACVSITDSTADVAYVGNGVQWYLSIIPQAVNGFSQLLVFPAVLELILTDAPRVMQGLLIGLWYAMYSVHILVGITETATCAVFYWEYYIMKIVLVLLSSIAFITIAFFYNHYRQKIRNVNVAPDQNQLGVYGRLQEEAVNPEEL